MNTPHADGLGQCFCQSGGQLRLCVGFYEFAIPVLILGSRVGALFEETPIYIIVSLYSHVIVQ